MQISRNTWHFKVFKWWYESKHKISLSESFSFHDYNLCPYVRAVLFWAAFRFLFSRPRIWGTIPIGLGLLITAVYEVFGKRGLIGLLGFFIFLMEVAGGLGMIFASAALLEYLQNHFKKNKNSPIVSFGTVIAKQAQAAHNKICPSMEFVD